MPVGTAAGGHKGVTVVLGPPGVLVPRPPDWSWEGKGLETGGAGPGAEPTLRPLHTKPQGKGERAGAGKAGSIQILLPLPAAGGQTDASSPPVHSLGGPEGDSSAQGHGQH